MLRILAILFGLTAALNDVHTAEAGIWRRLGVIAVASPLVHPGPVGGIVHVPSVAMEKGDAEDKVDIKKGKMYKKFAEMSKKKLMGMIKKYEKKIAIMKKVLKSKKKEKEN